MGKDTEEKFEDTLQDILTPHDPESPPSSRPEAQSSDTSTHLLKSKNLFPSRNIPQWVEILVRCIAALILVALLIGFGLQIVNR